MDYVIQKSVELGVSQITPIFSKFSEVRIKDKVRLEKKCSHWRRIARSSCEQCGRFFIPLVNSPVKFNEFVTNEKGLILLDPSGRENLKSIKKNGEVCLMTGPEGGFSPDEIEMARKRGRVVKLGPRILRAETAPVVALAILQSEFGDLN
jgi:16S rRNA (uracil1498-N3)-methyltransferase